LVILIIKKGTDAIILKVIVYITMDVTINKTES